MKKIILITGGQRSGKSMYAERLALSMTDQPIYFATARIWEEEFKERVKRHQARRGEYLSHHTIYNKVCVVDCITLWCTNFFFDANQNNPKEPVIDEALDAIKKEFDLFTAQEATFIFVTNEIGSGGVSDNVVQRRFTDMEGWMNQYVASKADEVVLMVSGIPVKIK